MGKEEWEERKAEYLAAHSRLMGYNAFGLHYSDPTQNPNMSSILRGTNPAFLPPDRTAGGPVVQEDILYSYNGNGFFVSCFVYFKRSPEPGQTNPAVVLSPGWGQPRSNSEFLNLGVALAEKGFVVLCMDHVEEGERFLPGAGGGGVLTLFVQWIIWRLGLTWTLLVLVVLVCVLV